MKGYSYTSTAPIGRTACTEPQCLYKGDLYLYLFFENQAVYEIMWKNIVEPGRPRMTMWRMRIAAGFLRLQIHTLRICNTHCFSTATMVVRTRLDVTLYVHCLSCLLSYPSLYVRIFQAFSYLKFYNKILYAFFFPMRVTWRDYPVLFDFTIIIIFEVKYKLWRHLLWIFLSSSCDYPSILPRPMCVFPMMRETKFQLHAKQQQKSYFFVC